MAEVKINGLTYEEWEQRLKEIMEAKRVYKEPIDPFHYWQGNYPPILAFEDMFPEETER